MEMRQDSVLASGASNSSDATSPSLRLGLGLEVLLLGLLALVLRSLVGILLRSLVGIGMYDFRLLAVIDCSIPSLGGFRFLFRILLKILDFRKVA